jgi:hypothetical protein
MMQYACDVCGKSCEFDFAPKKNQEYFCVCNSCNGVLDPGVWTEVQIVTGSESSCSLSETAIERLSKISSIPLDPDIAKMLSDHLWKLI